MYLVQVRGIFGFVGEDHIGKVMFPPVQVITSGLCTFSCFLKCLECTKKSLDEDQIIHSY